MKKKILLIDDDANMRSAIKRILLLSGDYEIAEASDGHTAEELISVFSPQLIVLDIKIPGKDGYEVCMNVKANSATSHIKIVGITGLSGVVGKAIMHSLGADSFFEKPFDNEHFCAEVNRLLEGEK